MTDAAGYSGKPPWQKLGLKAGQRVHVVAAPRDYRALTGCGEMPLVLDADAHCDLAHLFVTERASLQSALAPLLARVAAGGCCWVSWPKTSSALHRDLTEDGVRAVALPLGWVDVKVCAIDRDWSALQLRRRR